MKNVFVFEFLKFFYWHILPCFKENYHSIWKVSDKISLAFSEITKRVSLACRTTKRVSWKVFCKSSSSVPSYICKYFNFIAFSSFQLLSRVWLFATPWIAALQASLFITISWSSLRLTSIESVMPSSRLILGRPLLLLPAPNPSQHQSLLACGNL